MEERYFKFSHFSKIPHLIQGISTRYLGDMRFGKLKPEDIIKNRNNFFAELGVSSQEVVVANLVHQTKINTVGKNERGKGVKNPKNAILETDGLITSEKNVFLMLTVADCLPILFYDQVLRIVSVVHGGWRGIIGQIVSRSVDKFVNMGSDPANLMVGIGPGICQKHFIVRDEVLERFSKIYPKQTFVRNHDGYVDLKAIAFHDLKKAGVSEESIEISNMCTVCNNSLFGSFRKEGEGVPASAALIGMR